VLIAGASPAGADTPPPWIATEQTEHEFSGAVSFYDASGNQVFGGALDTPLAAYAVASGGLPGNSAANAGVTAYMASPQAGEPANFFQDTISSPAAVPYAGTLPASLSTLQTAGHLVVPVQLGYNDYAQDQAPSTYTGWTTTYEVRILGNDVSSWYAADIQVDTVANTWTQVFPAPALATTTTVSGPTTGVVGTAYTYTAAVTASSGSPTGTVQFQVDGTDLGSPETVATAAATGVQYTPIDNAAHKITAAYTSSDTAAFQSSSDTTGVTITATGTPITVPGAPTIGTATGGNARATVTWTAPADNGGAAVTSYHVQVSKNGGAFADATSPVSINVAGTSATVSGLTNGSSYAFKVAAHNVAGDGAYSAASSTVHPVADKTSLTMSASGSLRYGSSTKNSTVLKDATTGHPVNHGLVSLYGRTTPTGTWHLIGSVFTSSTGLASKAVTPTGRTYYQWRFAGNSTLAASTSPTRTITVSQVVTIAASPTRVKHGKTTRLYGTVAPSSSGQKVTIQRLVGRAWKTIGTVTIRKQKLPNGKTVTGYVLTYKLAKKGSYSFRAVKAATATLLAGTSATVKVSAT